MKMVEKILDVPYISQKVNYCGLACLAMVLKYYGENVSQDEIGEDMGAEYFSVSVGDLANYVRGKGFDAEVSQFKVSDLSGLIEERVPLIVVQRRSFLDKSGHYRVIIGRDESHGSVILHDPDSNGKSLFVGEKLFDSFWEVQGFRGVGLVVRKPEF
ncbi:C39 family peptidase [Methanococcoides sp. SA1]|nr:C39 family peptidase [Methanococcoides sp. SA1]